MASFPTYADILEDDYVETPDYGVLRTDTDGGIAKQRPTRSLPIVTRDATVYVESLADRLLFDNWFKSGITGGTGWFDWTDIDGVVKPTRIVNGQLSWSPVGLAWRGKVQLETVG